MSPLPIQFFLLKVASRCNLNCGYCYVYNHADQSWRDQPKLMKLDTARQLGERIHEHAAAHSIPSVRVSLHGGEPLLAGREYLGELCDALQAAAKSTKIRFTMQTNGTLLDEAWLDFLIERRISVGLSSDGPQEVSARRRPRHNGTSAFEEIQRATELLSSPEGRKIWAGFLVVIDIESSPLHIYDYLRSFNPPSIDFLFPLGHHGSLPAAKTSEAENTPYADWLLQIFKRWYREQPCSTMIRKFRDVIALSLGSKFASEEWGLLPRDLIVVESNGDIEATDSLKTTFAGASKLGLNIQTHSFDDALACDLLLERQTMWSTLCDECRRCPIVNVCGGGYFPHRYSPQTGFKNVSVYCQDIKKLVGEIQFAVRQDFDAARAVSSRTSA